MNDGTPHKASTNGTWFRLSGPHQESPPHLIQAGAEVLIGTVRFLVRERESVCLLIIMIVIMIIMVLMICCM